MNDEKNFHFSEMCRCGSSFYIRNPEGLFFCSFCGRHKKEENPTRCTYTHLYMEKE